MAATHFSGPVVSTNGFTAGSTTHVKGITYGTVAVDPASVNANSSAETAVTVTGAAVGDVVIFFVPASLEVGLALSGSRVSAPDTVQLRLSNHTASGVDGTSRTWEYIWIDLT